MCETADLANPCADLKKSGYRSWVPCDRHDITVITNSPVIADTLSDHPLAEVERISLEQLVEYPLISYQPAFTGRRRIDQAFAQRRLKPNIALEAIDSDVIKTYVRSGLGVGIVAEMAMQAEPPGSGLVAKSAAHLFGQNTSRVAFRRGAYLRSYVLVFAELLSPRLSRNMVERAMLGNGDHYEL